MLIYKKTGYTVFFDFDNTITRRDVFDDMVLRFSVNDRWKDLERRWKAGRIGSKECLKGQLEGIRIGKKRLDSYLAKIGLDPYFKRLIKLFESKNIKTIILSDNFDYILNRILENNGLKNLKIYSNKVKFGKDRLIPTFPFSAKRCVICAHCKKKNLLANADKYSTIVYIGDGLSDTCPSKYVDIVFAKGDLSEYLKGKGLSHIAYRGLKDVHDYFRKRLK